MPEQTRFAECQIEQLIDSFIERKRHEAAQLLKDALEEAGRLIDAAPMGGAPHPRPYPKMARWGFRWIKVHRYWVAWSMARGYPVVTNVFFDTSAMWKRGRVKRDEGDLRPL